MHVVTRAVFMAIFHVLIMSCSWRGITIPFVLELQSELGFQETGKSLIGRLTGGADTIWVDRTNHGFAKTRKHG